MPKHGKALLEGGRASVTISPVARRINVAVSASMLSAIDRVIEREHVTLTEAVRRLIAYGDFVYEATMDQRSTLVVRDGVGDEREIVML